MNKRLYDRDDKRLVPSPVQKKRNIGVSEFGMDSVTSWICYRKSYFSSCSQERERVVRRCVDVLKIKIFV